MCGSAQSTPCKATRDQKWQNGETLCIITMLLNAFAQPYELRAHGMAIYDAYTAFAEHTIMCNG